MNNDNVQVGLEAFPFGVELYSIVCDQTEHVEQSVREEAVGA